MRTDFFPRKGDCYLSQFPIMNQVLWMDSGMHTNSPIFPIAMDEALANSMSHSESKPIVHLWVYERALFLGRRDAKLPHLEAALRKTASKGYGALLRSSGGACVPLDAGVLNIAILLPNLSVTIDEFFRLAATLLQDGLQSYGKIEFGEVTGSYCVGDYDFAINGKKIGGMAQRRTRFGSILQLCINIEGSGLERGHLMENFYQEAGLHLMENNKPIPSIDSTTIGSIAELVGRNVTVDEVKASLWNSFSQTHEAKQVPFQLEVSAFEHARQHLQDKLQLFSYTAREIMEDHWHLP